MYLRFSIYDMIFSVVRVFAIIKKTKGSYNFIFNFVL